MRIVIDLQGAQTESQYRGIGRYCISLTKAMVRNRGNHEIIIALNGLFTDTIEPIRATFNNLLPQSNIRVWDAPGPIHEHGRRDACRIETAELIREAFLASLNPDIVHIMSIFEGYEDDAVTSIGRFDDITLVSASLFDLIPLLNPDHYLKPYPAYEEYYLNKIEHLRQSQLLLTISESSRIEGSTCLDFTSDNIVNTYAAADDDFHPLTLTESQTKETKDKFGLTRSFILCTGGADERKNILRLIYAYTQLPIELRNTHQLIFTGKIPEENIHQLQQHAISIGLTSEELVFTGYVTDNELIELYNMCKLYVFPSWHEGFGLPALEAMCCGAPVIGSSTSSLPEVIGRKDALFDPFSTESINRKMVELLSNDELRKSLSEHGLKQARKFSWDKSAKRAISALEQVVSAKEKHIQHLDHKTILTNLIASIASISDIDLHADEYASIANSISISFPRKQQTQLFVDVSELVQRDSKTGVQRVTRSILKELINNPPSGYRVEPVYANTNDTRYRYAREFTSCFTGEPANSNDEYIEFQTGDIFLGIDLQHYTTQNQAGFLTFMRNYSVKVFFVVYDLLPIQFPHYWPPELSIHSDHADWLSAITQFDGAVCISRAVADELTDWLEINGPERLRPYKISWFHLGADVENSVPTTGMPGDADKVLNSVNERTSFLMVGTIEPRKGYTQSLAAFEQLWADDVDVNLVIVGKKGWMVDELVDKLHLHHECGRRLFWLEGISDEFLEKLYAASTCLICASEGEGFGLPLIEAAQHKLAIVTRDIPVFREVAGENAFYFSGSEPNELAEAIQNWLALYKSDQHPRSDTMPWLTWNESARQLLKALGINEANL